MISTGRNKQSDDSANSSDRKHESTSLISLPKLLEILKRGRKIRSQFVESHLNKSIAYQIRSLRDQEKWTQADFADKLGIKHPNNVSARLENPNYGKLTLSTLKQIAATCDVALVVWFVPFSRFLKWVTGTPYLDNGLSEGFYEIPTFEREFEIAHVPLERMPVQSVRGTTDDFDSASQYAQDDRGKFDNQAQRAAHGT